ncbi:ATP-dependent RNA helicase DHX8/PRP22 [Pancytospora epiphaga]|nr:ATP-dependent RNA helicase DHX8/PRP22 [Pancytospora epiphaga]
MSAYPYPLLIERYRSDIEKIVEKNRVVIIKGPTGSGKSTFIPLLFKGSKMAIVEPRRIAVTSLYNTLRPHIPSLGFKMRFNKRVEKNTTVTLYTDGCFLNEIDSLEYNYIIIDEVHERTVRTDIILGILKNWQKGKIILMSASVDTDKLERYFHAKTYVIPGRSFPVDIKYLDVPTSDYIIEAYMTIRNILMKRRHDEKGDILVFLPGEEDINELQNICRKIPGISVYKMHSSMDDKEQARIYEVSNTTRVIISTNICETSLTIPNVKYVIDTGLCKAKIYDEIGYLGIHPISHESAVQRMGRCNRLGSGVCYKLYTEYEILPGATPEIVRNDLRTVFLQLLALGKNILNFDFLDFPPVRNCKSAIQFLMAKGCAECFYGNRLVKDIDTFLSSLPLEVAESVTKGDYTGVLEKIDFRITNYGRRISKHPFDAPLAHFYELCISSNMGYYAALLVSMVSQDNYNFMNSQPKTDPDILHLVYTLEKYMNTIDRKKFCNEHNIPHKGMEMACRIFKALDRRQEGSIEEFEKTFSTAFSHNLCIRENDGSFKMKRNGLKLYIHPSSAFFKRNDKKIVVVEIFCTTKNYARIVGKYFE